MVIKSEIQDFLDDFQKNRIVQKNLYDKPWLSGSVTIYPISILKKEITFQWKSNRKIFDNFINRTVKKYSNLLECGFFWKSDGSCPSTITFRLKE